MHQLLRDFTQLAIFVLPLAFTTIARDFGQQALNHGLGRGSNAVHTLAGFGLAYTFAKLFITSLEEFKLVGIVLVVDRATRRRCLVILLACGCFTALVMSLLGSTRLGVLFVEVLHGVNHDTGRAAYTSFLSLSVYPFFDSMSQLHAGCMLRTKRSGLVGMASMTDMGVQVVTVTGLVHTSLLCTNPLAIPICALYIGVICRLTMLVLGYYYLVHPNLVDTRGVGTANSPGYRRILRFFWPLALVKAIQTITRPLANLIAARSSRHLGKTAADQTVAVISLVLPIGHMAYGWINDMRALAPTFCRKRSDMTQAITMRTIGAFMLLCMCVSLAANGVLFWIPDVVIGLLTGLSGVSLDLARASAEPLRIFLAAPFTVIVRTHFTGWLMLHERTTAVAPSACGRLIGVIVLLFTLPQFGVVGAMLGVASLVGGSALEATLTAVAALWTRRKLSRMQQDTTRPSGQDLEMTNAKGFRRRDEERDVV